MNVEVRDYRESDLDSVNSILKEAFDTNKKNFDDEIFHEVVACIDEKVVGYLLLTKVLNPVKDSYYYLVDYVCVDSNYRGLGIGKKLLTYAEDIAKSDNSIYLQLTCSRFRKEAHKLYESSGYIKRDSDIFRKELI